MILPFSAAALAISDRAIRDLKSYGGLLAKGDKTAELYNENVRSLAPRAEMMARYGNKKHPFTRQLVNNGEASPWKHILRQRHRNNVRLVGGTAIDACSGSADWFMLGTTPGYSVTEARFISWITVWGFSGMNPLFLVVNNTDIPDLMSRSAVYPTLGSLCLELRSSRCDNIWIFLFKCGTYYLV